jgi:hypothetical protein
MPDVYQEPLYSAIPKVVLDPRDDVTLLEQMYMRVLNASGGKLNQVTPGSSLAALFEGIVYALATQRWYLNNLPEALAIEMFRFSGVKRSAGQFAAGEVTVLLTDALGSDFLMSAGTFLPASFVSQQSLGNQVGYMTTTSLKIPAGALEGTVGVKATVLGSMMNAQPFQLVISGQQIGLTYVNTVHNRAALTGGADVELMVDYLKRVQADLRSNGTLVSTADFERRVVELAGGGAYARAIPLMNANKTTPTPGHVSVFLIYNDFTKPSLTQCGSIRTSLLQDTLAGSYVNVFPMEFMPLQIDIVITVEQWSNTILDAVYERLYSYMAPGAFEPGTAVKIDELRYITRGTEGVQGVTTCHIEEKPYNVPMPNQWTIPFMSYLYLTQVDKYGNAQTLMKGYSPTQGLEEINE